MSYPLTESLICLSSRLRKTGKNIDDCGTLSCEYKPIQLSKNDEKKSATEEEIRSVVLKLYTPNKDDILKRDFSFLTKGSFSITDVSVGTLYINTLTEGDDGNIKSVTAELLQLFYHVMSEEDQVTTKSKYKKKKTKPKPSNMNMASDMQNMMEKHSATLANAENDPEATSKVLDIILKDDGMAKMARGMLSSMGIDLNKIGKKKK